MRRFLGCAVLAWLLPLAGAHAQTVEISGSTIVIKDRVQPVVPALRQATGVDVKSYNSSTGRGMVALFEGKAGMAAVAESLDEAVASARKSMAEIGKDRGGLAAVGESLLDGPEARQLKVLQVPPIDRPVALVTIGKPGESAQKVIDFLRNKK